MMIFVCLHPFLFFHAIVLVYHGRSFNVVRTWSAWPFGRNSTIGRGRDFEERILLRPEKLSLGNHQRKTKKGQMMARSWRFGNLHPEPRPFLHLKYESGPTRIMVTSHSTLSRPAVLRTALTFFFSSFFCIYTHICCLLLLNKSACCLKTQQ